ncbi:MAG: 3-keto-5-aminohexanoate cleavage protein [Thermincola sp.]|jgi:3-keto-5-aminohexanoate cleavage enzyme|nr:3-keto-5-aminohexanoate cleavage protein [Thermincola sp.]MDT3702842.1 3-keto-5-aminohexanoate cleavage protein [Thermincola sp.]
MVKKVIITVAPTGNFQGKEANPNLPIQPDEVAQAVYDSYNAGASVVHLHARDKNGVQTNDVNVFKEMNALVRSKCDIIIENSIAPALKPGVTAEDGLEALDALPEMASLDMGLSAITFRGLSMLIEWTRPFLRKAAQMMLDRGIKPELEIMNNSNMDDAIDLINAGLLKKPYYFNFVLGMNKVNQGATSFSPKHLMHYVDLLPPDSVFGALGIGPDQMRATTLSVMLGGFARVGFEDNIYYLKGELAKSNAQLVERIARYIHDLGLEVATPAEARDILGLPQLR